MIPAVSVWGRDYARVTRVFPRCKFRPAWSNAETMRAKKRHGDRSVALRWLMDFLLADADHDVLFDGLETREVCLQDGSRLVGRDGTVRCRLIALLYGAALADPRLVDPDKRTGAGSSERNKSVSDALNRSATLVRGFAPAGNDNVSERLTLSAIC